MKGNPALPGGLLESKPARWHSRRCATAPASASTDPTLASGRSSFLVPARALALA